MSAWGLLGNPTLEQIEYWKNLPYGEFKQMVNELKKKSKGKDLRKHAVVVKKTNVYTTQAFVYVQAFDTDHAIAQAKEINTSELEWSEVKQEPLKISYGVSQIW
jgi:hypothetical protein